MRVRLAIVAVCALAITLGWVILIERSNFEHDEAMRDVVRGNTNLAIAFEQQTLRAIHGADQALLYFRREYQRHGEIAQLSALSDDGLIDDAFVPNFLVTDSRGRVFLKDGRLGPIDVSDRDFFEFHRANPAAGLFISRPFTGRVTGKVVISLSRSMTTAEGAFAGVVAVGLDPAYFLNAYKSLDLGPRGLVQLVGLDGVVRARRAGDQESFGQDMHASSVLSLAAHSPSGNYVSRGNTSDGLRRFQSYRVLPGYPLAVTVGVAEDDALAAVRERKRQYYFGAAAFDALVLLLAAALLVAQAHRAKARAQQHELESRYRATFDHAAVGIAHTGLDGTLLSVNRKFCDLLGYPASELLGRRFFEFTHAEDVARSVALMKKAAAARSGTPLPEMEKRYIRKDGEVLWAAATVAAVGSGEGAPEYFVTMVSDVTARKAAERRVAVANGLYATQSAVSHAIAHSKTRHEVCERIVRISTEIGMWRGAWIGFVDAATKRIAPEAWSASMTPYIDSLAVSVDSALPEGRGPTGEAVRSGLPYFCNDIFADPATLPWRAFADAFGIHAVGAIPLQVGGSVAGVLNLYAAQEEIFTPDARALVIEMGDDISFALEMLETERHRRVAEDALLANQAKLHRSLESTIEAIAATIETRDPYTAGHQRRVADLARAIAHEMGLAESEAEGIHFGALIHDLGKVKIPAEILSKPTRLMKLEYELIKTHPQAGYEIIKGVDFPWPVAKMVLQHHERLDGTGYPGGLKGDEIVIEARILAVADVVEAMASHRPYRPGLGIEAALKEIEDKRDKWFDARAVDACLRLFREQGFQLQSPPLAIRESPLVETA